MVSFSWQCNAGNLDTKAPDEGQLSIERPLHLQGCARLAAQDLAGGGAVAGAAPALPGPLPVPGSQHGPILPRRQRTPRLLPATARRLLLSMWPFALSTFTAKTAMVAALSDTMMGMDATCEATRRTRHYV